MKLFEPIEIRGMTIKNRIVMSSMGMGIGYTNKRAIDFYVERARGGVGAIILGAGIPDMFASDRVWGKPGACAEFIERLHRLTGAVREAGARIGIQFYYGNRYPFALDPNVGELVAPSPRVEAPPSRHAWVDAGARLREITVGEIEAIVATIGAAAAGAREAGFDFVELHNAHGLLPCQFFSPTTNQRTDRYGGSLENRMRFGLECVRAMRAAVGQDYPLSVRHGAIDKVPDGYSLEEGIAFAVELEKAGIDMLNVSIGTPPFQAGYIPGGEDPEGTHFQLAEAVKRTVKIPVVAVGRVKTPEVAEAVLAEGRADLVAIGRQLIADPEWPRKVLAGKAADVTPCIDCHSCYELLTKGGAQCTTNYRASREAEATLVPAPRAKKVLVIGGGPAGMEAARVAAQRGHQVTLREASRQLGGAMLLQAMIPSKAPVETLTSYLVEEVKRAGVKVELGAEVGPEAVRLSGADAVVVAVGAVPVPLDVPGIDGPNVVGTGELKKMLSGAPGNGAEAPRRGLQGLVMRLGGAALGRPLPLSVRTWLVGAGIPLVFGKNVVVLGDGMEACQLADLLAQHGRKVTVLAKAQEPAAAMVSTLRNRLLNRLAKNGVTLVTGLRSYEEITREGVVIVDGTGARRTVLADTVMPVVGFRSSDETVEAMKRVASEVHVAGDCADPTKLLHAVHDGARVGREL